MALYHAACSHTVMSHLITEDLVPTKLPRTARSFPFRNSRGPQWPSAWESACSHGHCVVACWVAWFLRTQWTWKSTGWVQHREDAPSGPRGKTPQGLEIALGGWPSSGDQGGYAAIYCCGNGEDPTPPPPFPSSPLTHPLPFLSPSLRCFFPPSFQWIPTEHLPAELRLDPISQQNRQHTLCCEPQVPGKDGQCWSNEIHSVLLGKCFGEQ